MSIARTAKIAALPTAASSTALISPQQPVTTTNNSGNDSDSDIIVDLTRSTPAVAPQVTETLRKRRKALEIPTPAELPDIVFLHEAKAPAKVKRRRQRSDASVEIQHVRHQRPPAAPTFLPQPQLPPVQLSVQTILKDLSSSSANDDTSAQEEEQEDQKDPSSKSMKCPICWDSDGEQMSVSQCGHIFCTPCIKEWLQKKKFCPTCRKKLTAKQVHRLYL